LWSKTTHADKGQWEIVKDEHILVDVESTDDEGWEQTIGFGLYEKDAEFITQIHSALPDLVRRALAAFDEAERVDQDRDARECRIAELEMELSEANYINSKLRNDFAEELANVAELQSEVETLKADLEGLIAG
jgi:chromosome segregation ATPase